MRVWMNISTILGLCRSPKRLFHHHPHMGRDIKSCCWLRPLGQFPGRISYETLLSNISKPTYRFFFFFIWRSLTWCKKIFSLHRRQTSSLPVTFKPPELWRVTVHLFPLSWAPSSLPRQTPWSFQNINKHCIHSSSQFPFIPVYVLLISLPAH